MSKYLMVWGLVLTLLVGAARAATQVENEGWPAGDRWALDAYRRAVRRLMSLSVSRLRLPRLEDNPVEREFDRFLTPRVDPKRERDLKMLLELAQCVEKAHRVYLSQLAYDPSYGREAGAFLGVQSRLAGWVADLAALPANAALKPAALQIVTTCLLGLGTICRDPTQKPAETEMFVRLLDEFLERALPVLPSDCLLEIVVRLKLNDPPGPEVPASIAARLARIRDAVPASIPPALEKLIRRGMPAGGRLWLPEDVERAGIVLEATPFAELPHFGKPEGTPIARLAEPADLVWLSDEDLPMIDRVVLATQAMQGYRSARSAYAPVITVSERDRPHRDDLELEKLALDGAMLDVTCRMIVLQEKIEAGLPANDPTTYFKRLGFAATRRMRAPLLKMLIRSVAPLNGPFPEARARYLGILARSLPPVLPTLTDEGRADVVATAKTLPDPKAPALVREACAALVAAVR